jgi:SAM-dependent methyltransferase
VASAGALALICPEDASVLERVDRTWACPSCDARYPIEAGVARFLPESDAFYEGRYGYTIRFVPRSESPLFAWPLWLVSSGYLWAVRKHVPAGATVIEMGCASGVAYFAKRYRMIGLDLSLSSLARLAELYEASIQADATRIVPLPDASADAILSSFVWEHFPPASKPAVLAECARVLRPGGKLVFLHDVDPQNPIYRSMRRRNPALFQKILIEHDDHQGWQSPEENFAAFDLGGFDVVECRGNEKLLFSPDTYTKVATWPGWLHAIAAVGMRFRRGAAFHAWNLGVRVFDETVGRLLPLAWSRTLVVVCRRRDDAHTRPR